VARGDRKCNSKKEKEGSKGNKIAIARGAEKIRQIE
jgi:hypothetical protein